MLSEQVRQKIYQDAIDVFIKLGYSPSIAEFHMLSVLEIFEPHLQRDFDREAVEKMADVFLTNAYRNGQIVTSYIPGVVAIEFADQLKALQAGAEVTGPRETIDDEGSLTIESPCGTCGGKRRVICNEPSDECPATTHYTPCPDCKPGKKITMGDNTNSLDAITGGSP